MRHIILSLSCLATITLGHAQQQTFEYANSTVGSVGYVRFNNYAALGQKGDDKLDYSEVRGHCFWDDQWSPAIFILRSGNAVKIKKAKLNFYTNDIHYLDAGNSELVAQSGLVKKIIFFDRKDTLKFSAVFKTFASFKIKGYEAYVQVLNDGDILFLKRTEVTLVKANYDPGVGKPEFRFVSSTNYYIGNNQALALLKSISKENVLSMITPTKDFEEWLKSNKNKLKNEAEAIAFIAFCNAKKD